MYQLAKAIIQITQTGEKKIITPANGREMLPYMYRTIAIETTATGMAIATIKGDNMIVPLVKI